MLLEQYLFIDILDYKKKGWFQSPSTTHEFSLGDSLKKTKLVVIELIIMCKGIYGRGSGSRTSENLIFSTL